MQATIKRILIIALFFCCWREQITAQPISTEHNYAMNCPGIVMVQAVFSATVYVNQVEMNDRMFNKLVDSIRRLDTTGNLLSAGQKLDIVVKALYKAPFRFFSAGEEYYKQVHRVQSTGTGFLVTGDGYLVTNCHVIDRDSAFIRNKFIQSTFKEVTEANINALQSSWAVTLTDQQRSLLHNAYGLIYSQLSSMILFDLKKDIFISYKADNQKRGSVIVRKKATVIRKGKPMPGKDVAVLKIEGETDLPTLVVSDDSIVRVGTQVLVLGYPEPVTSNTFLATEANIEPTLTTGIVSTIKKSIGGWPVIQMDAMITHGSSGSPVCNDKGEVVGLATFGSLEQGGNTLASGFNFAIPISVVREYLDSSNLQPVQSETSSMFNEGLGFYYQQFYQKALDRFEKVKKLNSNYPQLLFFMEQCKAKISMGNQNQAPPRKYVVQIMLLIAVFSAFYYFLRKRRLLGRKKETGV